MVLLVCYRVYLAVARYLQYNAGYEETFTDITSPQSEV